MNNLKWTLEAVIKQNEYIESLENKEPINAKSDDFLGLYVKFPPEQKLYYSLISDALWVENCNELFEYIAESFLSNEPIIIAWSEGRGTQFDISFTHIKNNLGGIQGGIRNIRNHLFVSIMQVGAFAFEIDDDYQLECDYVSKRLHVGWIDPEPNVTLVALTELINGVIQQIILQRDLKSQDNSQSDLEKSDE